MKRNYIIAAAATLIFIGGCKPKNQYTDITISPDAGTNYKLGDKVTVKITLPADTKPDSVVYLIDSVKFASKNNAEEITLPTDTFKLGPKVITARVYQGAQPQETSTNINLLAAKAPEAYTFKLEKTFPHDTASYIEGLEYHDGVFYESDGGYASEEEGRSSLRKTDPATGKILKKIDIDPQIFAEGITVIGNKIVQLTYKEKIGFVYDKDTFKTLSKFSYTTGREGWGLCNDGKRIYNTDGSNAIYILDINDYHKIGEIDVFDDQKQVENLNELEYIDGLLYANIYGSNNIVVIDPKSGAVLRKINLDSLYPQNTRPAYADVMNGIAWDGTGKRLFVTGKKWPHLYQVKFVKQ